MQGLKHGINYNITTAILRSAENAAIREDEDEPKVQPPLLPNATDVVVPKVTRDQVPFLRAYLQGATITGHRLRHITGKSEHTVCPFSEQWMKILITFSFNVAIETHCEHRYLRTTALKAYFNSQYVSVSVVSCQTGL
eukprot:357202-Pyramimonas_sp.AAC.1